MVKVVEHFFLKSLLDFFTCLFFYSRTFNSVPNANFNWAVFLDLVGCLGGWGSVPFHAIKVSLLPDA